MSSIAHAGTASPPVARWKPGVAVLAIFAGLVASQALALGVVLAAGHGRGADEIHGAAVLVGEVPLLVAVLVVARRGAPRLTAATFGLRRTPFWSGLGWAAAFYVGILGAEGLYLVLVGGHGSGHGSAHAGGHLGVAAAVMALAGIAVVAPIVEEVSFRGYLFPALTRWRGPWVAALVTAVLFAGAHLTAYPPVVLPAMFVFGYGACLVRWFTGSLLPGIGLHALNNGIVTATAVGGLGALFVAGSLLAPVVAILVVLPLAREHVARDA